MPTKRASSCGRLVVLGLASAICLGLAAAAGLALWLPGASADLGPASPAIPPAERALISSYLLLRMEDLQGPAGDPGALLELRIESGASARGVADQLAEAGIVADRGLFLQFMRYRGLDRTIETGLYYLSGEMSIPEIASLLQSAETLATRLTIPEGWRTGQIADLVAESNLPISREEFLAAASARPAGYSFTADLPPGAGLEGFLFPDTYLFDPQGSAVDLVMAMLDVFELRVSPGMRAGFSRQGLTLYEAVTLASIVEREARVPGERQLIASVFINRLRAGMKLEADPTVQYAIGLTPDGSWWKSPLTLSDLQLDSPYNTYQVAGLPPGPIANPGLASLTAVSDPAESDYLYFQAACDGSGRHQFARTFEEHLANSCP